MKFNTSRERKMKTGSNQLLVQLFTVITWIARNAKYSNWLKLWSANQRNKRTDLIVTPTTNSEAATRGVLSKRCSENM